MRENNLTQIFRKLSQFRADRAWGALDLAEIEGATVRLHWTDQPYRWHVNDGPELFLVLEGVVEMRFLERSEERLAQLEAGDAFHAGAGDAHVATPIGEARILVVEKKGSE
jgi:mannose-6-phosphate isomerase-like protein (cupin superfamily)